MPSQDMTIPSITPKRLPNTNIKARNGLLSSSGATAGSIVLKRALNLGQHYRLGLTLIRSKKTRDRKRSIRYLLSQALDWLLGLGHVLCLYRSVHVLHKPINPLGSNHWRSVLETHRYVSCLFILRNTKDLGKCFMRLLRQWATWGRLPLGPRFW